jgi:hypothetical protein
MDRSFYKKGGLEIEYVAVMSVARCLFPPSFSQLAFLRKPDIL